jgi:phospholipase/carboxylesterase
LYQGLRHPEALAGILALSTYLVLADTLEAERSAANAELPLFQAHGTFDPMVPFEAGELARRQLEDLGYAVEWHQYPMQHQVVPQEIDAIGKWLNRTLGD